MRFLVDAPARVDGEFVLYWMTSARRTRWNFGLQRAVRWARELKKPLVVLEALRADYLHASDRFHRFVLDGMRYNERALENKNVLYYPFVERTAGAGKGLIAALGKHACVLVTDDYPCFFLPRMLERASRDVRARFEAVDSNGLLPMRAADRAFARAFDLRRYLQRELRPHLELMPSKDPLARVELPVLSQLPADIVRRWPRADARLLAGTTAALSELPIDHDVAATTLEGGAGAGERVLKRFVDERLASYDSDRNDVDVEATSGLSPYLHFGHVGAHQVFERIASLEQWSLDELSSKHSGTRAGWWGMSAASEAFLDQLVTWRELGFNACAHVDGYDTYAALPAWARETLELHAADERPECYTLKQFENAATHDELWNAAQNQLRAQGVIHNYLRMLWGKKILHWSKSPRAALATMIELNDKYALDGRDPNSYCGILWTLGKFDRPWGPERPIFGKVRYMTSDNTRRKLKVGAYIERWSSQDSLFKG
ncbi:MAG: deoxyribodipyrimidine photolyase [Planctomycetes bacterium]|nr:deoxyribodipyrimidine photolyase [Planctomycetota bacterium]